MDAEYLRKSDDTELAKHVIIYLEGEGRYTRVVIKNDEDDPILIFRLDSVADRVQHEDLTKIDLYININNDPRVLYKFGFATPALAAYLFELCTKE